MGTVIVDTEKCRYSNYKYCRTNTKNIYVYIYIKIWSSEVSRMNKGTFILQKNLFRTFYSKPIKNNQVQVV